MSFSRKAGDAAARPVNLEMRDPADHVTGVTGLTVTVEVGKNGGTFLPAVGPASETGNGIYTWTPDAADLDTLGELAILATAPGADPCRRVIDVKAYDEGTTSTLAANRLFTRVQSDPAAPPVNLLLTDPADHVTGAPGLDVTVTVSKNGGVFGAAAGTVQEVGSGWYAFSPAAADLSTVGELLIHATATGGDDTDRVIEVASSPGGGGGGGGGTGTASANVAAPGHGARLISYPRFGGGLVLDTDAADLQRHQCAASLNIDLDTEAIVKRKGKARYNATPADAEAVDAVGAYYPKSGARSVVVKAGDSLYVDANQDGDFADTDEAVLTGLTPDSPTDLIQFQDTLYLGNREDGLRAWDGTFPPDPDLNVYTPAISATPSDAPVLSVQTVLLEAFESGSWAARKADNSGAGTITPTLNSVAFREGMGSLQLSIPNTAVNEFVWLDLTGGELNLTAVEALQVWLQQTEAATVGMTVQVAVQKTSDAGGSPPVFDWDLFPAVQIEAVNTWQQVRVPLNAVPKDELGAVAGLAIRFLAPGDGTYPLQYLYVDGMYALGPFPPDTYEYWSTRESRVPGGHTLQESNPSPKAELVIDDLMPVYAITVELLGGVSTAGQVDVARIYRHRKAGQISTAKLITTTNETSLTYTDRTSDSVLLLENRADMVFGRAAPPVAATYAAVRHRLFAGNTADAPWRVFISEFAYPERFGDTLDPAYLANGPGYLDLPERDQIRRIIDVDGMALIFTDRSVWSVEGTGFDNFELRKRAGVGLVAREAVVYTGHLVYFYSQDGLRVLAVNRGNPGTFETWRIDEPVGSRVRSIPAQHRPQAAMGVDERGRVHFSYTPAGGSYNSRALVFDPRSGDLSSGRNPLRAGWTYYTGWGFSCFHSLRGGDEDQGDLLGGDVGNGTVWRLHQDASGAALETDDGAAIDWSWTGKAEDANDMARGRSRFRPVSILAVCQPQPSAVLDLDVILDQGRARNLASGTLPVATIGVQFLSARQPAGAARFLQARVSGSHSVAIAVDRVELGVYVVS